MSESNRNFGIEIEFVCENHDARRICDDLEKVFPNWLRKSDSSIQPYGIELNSPILSGKEGLAEVEKMVDWLKNNPLIRVNPSCGLHVHVESSDLTPEQIIIASHRYGMFEEEFFDKIMEPHRNKENQYCRTAKGNNIQETMPAELPLLKASFSNFSEFVRFSNFDKYRKLNIQCQRHPTIEFRHHHATLNKMEILNWISFITCFIDSTKERTKDFKLSEEYFTVSEPTKIPDDVTAANRLHAYWKELRLERPRGLVFWDYFSDLLRYGYAGSMYETDFIEFSNKNGNRPANQIIWDKLKEMGFELKTETRTEPDRYNDRGGRPFVIYEIWLKYGDIDARLIVDKRSSHRNTDGVMLLGKINEKLMEIAKEIDILDNIPLSTMFYYSNLFKKKNKIVERAKMATLRMIKEKPRLSF